MLLALSFQGARTEQKQRQVLSEHKPRIKRWLNEPSPADYLEVLPEDVNLLPASLVAAAFGQDPRVDCALDEKQLLGVAMQWPLRQRQSGGSMLAAPAIPTWEASTIGPFLSGIAAASAYAAHWGPAASGQRGLVTIGTPGVTLESVQSSAGSSGAMGSGTPVPRVVSGTPVATAEPEQLRAAGQEPIQQKPLLALEDRVEPPPQASHVDRAQEQLKSSVAVVTASPTRGQRSESSVQKKPAGKKASKPVLKKTGLCEKASGAAEGFSVYGRCIQSSKARGVVGQNSSGFEEALQGWLRQVSQPTTLHSFLLETPGVRVTSTIGVFLEKKKSLFRAFAWKGFGFPLCWVCACMSCCCLCPQPFSLMLVCRECASRRSWGGVSLAVCIF